MRINQNNFKRICGLNGTTPTELVRSIRRHKTTVYKALRMPHRFKPTYRLIDSALPIREVRRG